jgi:acetyltransferase-like isoleucine patch superfamily enzyme
MATIGERWRSYVAELRLNSRENRSLFALAARRLGNSARTIIYLALKCRYARRRGLLRIPWNVTIWAPNRIIEFGHRVQFGPGCVIQCDIRFGNHILVANNVAFVGRHDHRIDIVGKTIWDSPRGPDLMTIVEDDVWIGHGSIILAGVRIGRGAVVAAGSVVLKDVEPYSVVAGVPAARVKERFTPDDVIRHETALSRGGGGQAEQER